MRIINLEQGSKDWHAFRKEGIGSSDIAAILGVSPWKTIEEVYHEKTKDGETKETKGNWAMQRGKEVEPEVRDRICKERNILYTPVCGTHESHTFIRASFDGYDSSTSKILEIKFAGREDHETAKSGEVPKKYIPQVQWLMLVAGSDSLDYCSYNSNEIIIVNVAVDKDYQMMMLEKAKEFWQGVTQKQSPVAAIDPELAQLLKEYSNVEYEIKMYNKTRDALKEKIMSLTPKGSKSIANGITAQWVVRSGQIDYVKVCKDTNLSTEFLEKYRKEDTTYFLIR